MNAACIQAAETKNLVQDTTCIQVTEEKKLGTEHNLYTGHESKNTP